MAAPKKSINLLNDNLVPLSKWDIIYNWTTQTAKYLLIVVELLVVIAFFVRLTTDGKINDLELEIQDALFALDAQRPMEQRINRVAAELKDIERLNEYNYNMSDTYRKVMNIIPQNITINQITIQADTVTLTGKATDAQTLANFEQYIKDNEIPISSNVDHVTGNFSIIFKVK